MLKVENSKLNISELCTAWGTDIFTTDKEYIK